MCGRADLVDNGEVGFLVFFPFIAKAAIWWDMDRPFQVVLVAPVVKLPFILF